MKVQLELKVCTLIQDEPTHWNSSFYTLKGLLNREKQVVLQMQNKWNIWCYSKLAEEVIKLLHPFEEVTEDISSETSSIALFIPIVNSLSKLLHGEEDHDIMGI